MSYSTYKISQAAEYTRCFLDCLHKAQGQQLHRSDFLSKVSNVWLNKSEILYVCSLCKCKGQSKVQGLASSLRVILKGPSEDIVLPYETTFLTLRHVYQNILSGVSPYSVLHLVGFLDEFVQRIKCPSKGFLIFPPRRHQNCAKLFLWTSVNSRATSISSCYHSKCKGKFNLIPRCITDACTIKV